MKLPPLTALRFFDMAARYESFVKAAQELHITHSAISRQIRLLEEYLGVALFERRNRAVFLTAEGKLLFQTTANMFQQLAETVEKIIHHPQSQMVSLSCEPTIAMKWLIPRLTRFYQQHPEITVHLVAAGGPIDFAKTGTDLALRRNDFIWSDNIYATKICAEWMGVVKKLGDQPYTDMPLLVPSSRPNVWQTWQSRSGINLQKNKRISFEHFYLCLQAALAGQGAAIASFLMVADEIETKQLIAPEGFIEDGSAYYLLSAKEINANTPVAIFKSWLEENVRQSLLMTQQSV
ncbi:LysR family transcriptional regulator [Providencia alcalifaciens]|uniref:LysR family transcriptional regulator n=2 Tax=Providencia alcalifaciens TaxID=126385 RepID=A0AAW9V6L1_9GAMM|nr:LysR family transcriptional regulator [Providencia alcalifaciens]MTC17085.1 LysR family transcriptional regulator [Providencia alcalifaciens]MTC33294.1 LysR family transcriptional regulator [Providencia alcalifaciens]MTC64384.1 LysR family transcriptional regulator [Providencia alcalifaciens]WGZ53869.1 LysR family transcriptional regulator [Providencia alcalifaciens]